MPPPLNPFVAANTRYFFVIGLVGRNQALTISLYRDARHCNKSSKDGQHQQSSPPIVELRFVHLESLIKGRVLTIVESIRSWSVVLFSIVRRWLCVLLLLLLLTVLIVLLILLILCILLLLLRRRTLRRAVLFVAHLIIIICFSSHDRMRYELAIRR